MSDLALTKPLTARIVECGGHVDLDAYERAGGYTALGKAVTTMDALSVQTLVKDAGLRGRGGAGFVAGLKWSFVAIGAKRLPGHTYLVCNADEMEPGTFKDRYLMENDPHLLIEGAAIASFAIEADIAYIFLRGDYYQAGDSLDEAVAAAYAKGYLGKNIFGTGFNLELRVHRSAGRYICGEETALLNALEGKRAQPRTKPPFPPVSGAWGRPSVVNNCETLCNVPAILRNGIDWYKALGKATDAGTKLYGISGRVNKPGLWELPIGTTMRELLEVHAGGMQPGRKFKALMPGGASTSFFVESELDTPMDFAGVAAAKRRMGTGTMVVIDDTVCPIGLLRNLEHFFAQESCGFCTPCRDGLPWVEQLLADIDEGRGTPEVMKLLESNANFIGVPGNTFCLHATGAIEPLFSAFAQFKDDFEEHIRLGHCPYQKRPPHKHAEATGR